MWQLQPCSNCTEPKSQPITCIEKLGISQGASHMAQASSGVNLGSNTLSTSKRGNLQRPATKQAATAFPTLSATENVPTAKRRNQCSWQSTKQPVAKIQNPVRRYLFNCELHQEIHIWRHSGQHPRPMPVQPSPAVLTYPNQTQRTDSGCSLHHCASCAKLPAPLPQPSAFMDGPSLQNRLPLAQLQH